MKVAEASGEREGMVPSKNRGREEGRRHDELLVCVAVTKPDVMVITKTWAIPDHSI